MANQSPSLRFDHREIAVIFMLFIFVSLLMFTVGILVGKGLTQARYEGGLGPIERNLSNLPPASVAPAPGHTHTNGSLDKLPTGSSVTTPLHESDHTEVATKKMDTAPEETTLKLIPQKTKESSSPASLLEPRVSPEAENILKNPKIQALLERDPKLQRKINSLGVPESYASGKFSVQIGSYPNEVEATERVESLKKLGFPHAHFSAKELGENKEIWYRVWLGYFPDYDGANESGKALKERGEVKQYLVRKVDSTGRPD